MARRRRFRGNYSNWATAFVPSQADRDAAFYGGDGVLSGFKGRRFKRGRRYHGVAAFAARPDRPQFGRRRRRKSRRGGISMARRRRHSTRARRRSLRRKIGGWRTLRGFVSPRRRRFTLKRRSPFKRRMRGYKVNPSLAAYMMGNPRRRGGYRGNPATGLLRGATSAFNVGALKQGGFGLVGLVGTITVSNMLAGYLVPYLPSMLTAGYAGTATKAAVRGATVYLLDRLVGGFAGRNRGALLAGCGLAVVGSLLLDLMGKTFVLGAGDGMQQPMAFVPSIPGLGTGTAGVGATGSYALSRLRGTRGYMIPEGINRVERSGGMSGSGSVPTGMGRLANSAHRRLYGGD